MGAEAPTPASPPRLIGPGGLGPEKKRVGHLALPFAHFWWMLPFVAGFAPVTDHFPANHTLQPLVARAHLAAVRALKPGSATLAEELRR